MRDPYIVHSELLDAFIHYVQTPFAFRSEQLEQEREELLRNRGVIYQDPLIEPILAYTSSGMTLEEACQKLGLGSDLAEFIFAAGKHSFFPKDRRLYTHQFDALKNFSEDGSDVVITTGTGSGKTETFFLPIFRSLIEESREWEKAPARGDLPRGFSFQREHERSMPKRLPALRALVLYPLNALIEDQLSRLRKALDSTGSKKWLDDNRGGNRFYFGRYTGKTPVSGIHNDRNWQRLRTYVRDVRKTSEMLSRTSGGEDYKYFFQSAERDSAELISRWDMHAFPPDIMITNYSMLNIMLMRRIEEQIFERTRAWLKGTDRPFFLVVDELHTYRGTSGSEVAYLFRVLLDRLGLSPDSDQLKIVSASASIAGGDEGQDYLKQLFGRGTKFSIISGSRNVPQEGQELKEYVSWLESVDKAFGSKRKEDLEIILGIEKQLGISANGNSLERRLGAITEKLGLHATFARVCLAEDGQVNAVNPEEIAKKLGIKEAAARGLIRVLTNSIDSKGNSLLPVRAHMLFKNLEGFWACSNSDCVSEEKKSDDAESRGIGKLFSSPSMVCGCGGRVLQVLYCQTCGDVFLGGFRNKERIVSRSWLLSPNIPDLESLPERLLDGQTYSTYAVYWPRKKQPSRRNWNERGFQRGWYPAKLNDKNGEVHLDETGNHSGWMFFINSRDSDELRTKAWKPKYCPNCDDVWWHPTDTERTARSPIRHLGTGLQKISQILSHNLMEELDSERRKLVVFSDSRSDAAKLSAGVKSAHYMDLTRLLVFEGTTQEGDQAPAVPYIKFKKGEKLSPSDTQAALEFTHNYQTERELVDHWFDGKSLSEADQAKIKFLSGEEKCAVKFNRLLDFAEFALVKLGINPAGFGQFYQISRDKKKWTELYNWESELVEVKGNLTDAQKRLREAIRNELQRQLSSVLFGRANMGYEAVALGLPSASSIPGITTGKAALKEQVIDSVIRMMGEKERFVHNEFKEDFEQLPRAVQDYLEK